VVTAALGVREDEIIVFASDLDGDYDLYALLPDQPEPRRLTRSSRQERSPAISPDGTTIAYVVGTEPRRDIWLMDADGGRQRRLTSHPADDIDPAWSADGRSLAFASRRSDPLFDIFEIRDRGSGLDERNARNLTTRPALEHLPDWAPSGRRLAIASNHFGGNRNIVLIDADGPSVLQLRTATVDFDFHPSWSPDGRLIAFHRRTFCRDCPSSRGTADLRIMDSRGGSQRRLTRTPVRNEVDPDWAPDGRAFVFAAGPSEELELYAIAAEGGGSIRLTDGWSNAVEPTWGRRAAAAAPSATASGSAP
jgi:TolB protein